MEDEVIKMEVVNPHAAGIDVGSRSHWVAVGQKEEDVREYGVFNDDLFSFTTDRQKIDLAKREAI